MEGFEGWKKSKSREVMLRQEVEFMNRIMEAMKSSCRPEKRVSRKVITREGRGGRSELQTILLMKENQILKEQLNEQATAVPPEKLSKEEEE